MHRCGSASNVKGGGSTAAMLKPTVGQFREALKMDKHVVRITAKQCKIIFEHYRPLHPVVIAAVRSLIEGRGDNERVFSYTSFANFVWKDRNEILLSRINSHFVVGDLRRFTEKTEMSSVGSSQIAIHLNARSIWSRVDILSTSAARIRL